MGSNPLVDFCFISEVSKSRNSQTFFFIHSFYPALSQTRYTGILPSSSVTLVNAPFAQITLYSHIRVTCQLPPPIMALYIQEQRLVINIESQRTLRLLQNRAFGFVHHRQRNISFPCQNAFPKFLPPPVFRPSVMPNVNLFVNHTRNLRSILLGLPSIPLYPVTQLHLILYTLVISLYILLSPERSTNRHAVWTCTSQLVLVTFHQFSFKTCVHELSLLSRLPFCLSFHFATFPVPWNYAEISPIFRRSDPFDPNDCSPIFLTFVIFEAFETITSVQSCSFVKREGLLSNRQYGFPRLRSVGNLLASVSHSCSTILDNHKETHVVSLNISKSFDIVWQGLSLSGFLPVPVPWTSSFLSKQTSHVLVEEVPSQPHECQCSPGFRAHAHSLLFIADILSTTSSSVKISSISHSALRYANNDIHLHRHWRCRWVLIHNTSPGVPSIMISIRSFLISVLIWLVYPLQFQSLLGLSRTPS